MKIFVAVLVTIFLTLAAFHSLLVVTGAHPADMYMEGWEDGKERYQGSFFTEEDLRLEHYRVLSIFNKSMLDNTKPGEVIYNTPCVVLLRKFHEDHEDCHKHTIPEFYWFQPDFPLFEKSTLPDGRTKFNLPKEFSVYQDEYGNRKYIKYTRD